MLENLGKCPVCIVWPPYKSFTYTTLVRHMHEESTKTELFSINFNNFRLKPGCLQQPPKYYGLKVILSAIHFPQMPSVIFLIPICPLWPCHLSSLLLPTIILLVPRIIPKLFLRHTRPLQSAWSLRIIPASSLTPYIWTISSY